MPYSRLAVLCLAQPAGTRAGKNYSDPKGTTALMKYISVLCIDYKVGFVLLYFFPSALFAMGRVCSLC
jgi:hypothetical protein